MCMEIIEKPSDNSLEDFNNLESVSFLLIFVASVYLSIVSGFDPVFFVVGLVSFIMVLPHLIELSIYIFNYIKS